MRSFHNGHPRSWRRMTHQGKYEDFRNKWRSIIYWQSTLGPGWCTWSQSGERTAWHTPWKMDQALRYRIHTQAIEKQLEINQKLFQCKSKERDERLYIGNWNKWAHIRSNVVQYKQVLIKQPTKPTLHTKYGKQVLMKHSFRNECLSVQCTELYPP